MTTHVTDFFSVTPLGAGREVGRSCFYCKFCRAGVRSAFLLDCGVNPSISEDNAQSDIPGLPFFDLIDEPLDYILITHFHNDHVSGLPFLLNAYRGDISRIPPIYMTRETQDISLLNLKDEASSGKLFHHISLTQRKQTADFVLDLLKKSIRTVAFNEFVKLKHNTSLTIYPAGHVIGAAMYYINIAGFSLLYTGDWSVEKDISLKQAELPLDLRPDLLITEGTYGTLAHTERGEREQKLIKACVDTLLKDGRVILPVFAVGRVQELLKILDNHWKTHPELQKYDIYYISSIGKNFSKDEQFVKHEKDSLMITRNVPCIIFATPGMLEQGVSRQLFEEHCGLEKNLLMITGYGAEGSYLHSLLQRVKADKNILIKKRDGTQEELKMRILEISFSAHSDLFATLTLIETVRPKNLCLIHGSHGALEKLEARLRELYHNKSRKIQYQMDHPDKPCDFFDLLADMKIFVPDNGETLTFSITASVQAQYASEEPFDSFIKGAVNSGQQVTEVNDIFLKKPKEEEKTRDFYVNENGIEFTFVDKPSNATAQFRMTLGCDLQIKLRELSRRLALMFGQCFVTEAGSQFEVNSSLFDEVVGRSDGQFDIIYKIIKYRQEPHEELKNMISELPGEELRITLFRNGNSRETMPNEEEDGYYCEISATQRAQHVERFIMAKIAGKYQETTRVKAEDFAELMGQLVSFSSDSNVLRAEGTILRELDAFWYPESSEGLSRQTLDAIKDANLIGLVDMYSE